MIKVGEVRKILNRRGLFLTKRMGQNLLVDKNIQQKIMEAGAVSKGDTIVEVGPGLGALTSAFIERGAEVWAVEKDRGLYNALSEELTSPALNLYCVDAMVVNWHTLLPATKAPFKFIANLPYNITTPLLFKLLAVKELWSFLLVMVQKEAAKRWLAQPRSAEYGAVTLKINFLAEPQSLFEVSPRCFFPVPEVDSVVVKMLPRKKPPVAVRDQAFFFKIIEAGFSQRRKTLYNCLKNLNLERDRILTALDACGLEPSIRGEELDLAGYACLVENILGWKEGV